ncbi:MAG: hypothetical protein ACREJO_12170 [Phycisphaerales bacterium]
MCRGTGWTQGAEVRAGAAELTEEQWACVGDFAQFFALVRTEGVGLVGAMAAEGITELDPRCAEALRVVDGEMGRLDRERDRVNAEREEKKRRRDAAK